VIICDPRTYHGLVFRDTKVEKNGPEEVYTPGIDALDHVSRIAG